MAFFLDRFGLSWENLRWIADMEHLRRCEFLILSGLFTIVEHAWTQVVRQSVEATIPSEEGMKYGS